VFGIPITRTFLLAKYNYIFHSRLVADMTKHDLPAPSALEQNKSRKNGRLNVIRCDVLFKITRPCCTHTHTHTLLENHTTDVHD